MRATLVGRTGDRATVRLTPCWIARWLGAWDVTIELHKSQYDGWKASGSDRLLRDLPHASKIRNALDFVPTVPLPKAETRLRLVVNNDKKNREASE